MANPPPFPEGERDRESTNGMSRWVKVVAVVLGLVVLLFLAMQMIGGGHQIPQHAPSPGTTWVVPAPTQYLR